MENKAKEILRESNLELLRIFATIMVIAYHCAQHSANGEFSIMGRILSINTVLTVFLGSWGTLGVDIFLIISCWFLVDREGISPRKIILLTLQTWFLSIFVTAVVFWFNGRVELGTILKEFLTPYYGQFWFITAYLLFYMCVPLLQITLRFLNEKDLKKIIFVGAFVVSLYYFILDAGQGGNIATFVYIFYIIAYLKRNKNNFIENHCKSVAIVAYLGIGGGMLIINLVGNYLSIRNVEDIMLRICARNWIPVQLLAISIFYIFKEMAIEKNSVINTLARGSLGVYVLHENMLFRASEGTQSILWGSLFDINSVFDKPYYILVFFANVLCVYLVCSFIEYLRYIFIEKQLLSKSKTCNMLLDRFDEWFSFESKYIKKKV